MHRPRAVVLVASMLTAAACSGVDEPARARADASAEVVTAAVGASAFSDLDERTDLVVWIYPLPHGEPIDLEVQVEVLELLEEFATIRFVDSFEEAVEDNDGDLSVIDDGVVVGLGNSGEDPPRRIEVERYETGDDEPSSSVYVRRQGSWEKADSDR